MTPNILLICVLGVLTLLLAWLSLLLAGLEAAVTRVTRSSLNNLTLETQTDESLTKFARMKRLEKINRVQSVVTDRNATASSAAFFRIVFNILCGVLVTIIAAQFTDGWWIDLLVGLAGALIVGFLSVMFRPRMTGAAKPLDLMVRHSRMLKIAVVLTPFARITGVGKGFREDKDKDFVDDESIEKIHYEQGKAMVDRMVEATTLDPEIAEMLRNVVTLSETLTREIMVPRTDMICVGEHETLTATLQLFSRSGFSRIPVIGDSVDDLVGMAYLKDAVRATAFNPEAGSREVRTIVRDPLLVPESKPTDDLFHQMQRQRQHIAIVVDEWGGIAGLVTIEDAIEQIVGELEDEHDRSQKQEPEKIGPTTWRVPARTPIADLEEIFEIDIDEDDVDTVYGLLTKLLGRVPIVGESAVTRGLRLTAVDSAGRRKKVSMILVEPASILARESDALRKDAEASSDSDATSQEEK
ncbi:MAG: hemolysin family protein [Bifidobacteriaceae bacterium]|jgi:CBS domain containing-hemolysin-like protein|nr:hemolysin family protein [Bifidobacteriaceae bacterium]MCI1914134.1 hemolysin family protein [Bifidobacteriaceae bacterium]